jgi:hypothetical protein
MAQAGLGRSFRNVQLVAFSQQPALQLDPWNQLLPNLRSGGLTTGAESPHDHPCASISVTPNLVWYSQVLLEPYSRD